MTKRLAKRIVKAVMQLRPLLIFVIVRVAMAATVARAAVTRDRVAVFEFTVAAIIAVQHRGLERSPVLIEVVNGKCDSADALADKRQRLERLTGESAPR